MPPASCSPSRNGDHSATPRISRRFRDLRQTWPLTDGGQSALPPSFIALFAEHGRLPFPLTLTMGRSRRPAMQAS